MREQWEQGKPGVMMETGEARDDMPLLGALHRDVPLIGDQISADLHQGRTKDILQVTIGTYTPHDMMTICTTIIDKRNVPMVPCAMTARPGTIVSQEILQTGTQATKIMGNILASLMMILPLDEEALVHTTSVSLSMTIRTTRIVTRETTIS
ncbi:hypothetical protein SKAU_G00412200 [Synaphobranchus kaupii]|uniref:Uncharacterized protein n=1 Tax=Synaphobranchus kaupii TaxID=118154 RepID=A0A9Q1IBV7_SYNKA|nr:hypothetical protein SKAU_G00412200 [Synaphobranchus kaupii]